MPAESVVSFQEKNFNHLGQPLDIDGVLGPETRWSMNFVSLSIERRLVIIEGQRFIGLKETSPNDEPTGTIDGWLKRANAKEGDPWCAAAASAWLSVVIPTKIAGAVRLGMRFPPTDNPWVGDLFWYPTNSKGNGHVGFVLGVGSTEVMTLEGNCDNAVRVTRRPRSGLRFAKTFEETMGICPKVLLSVPLAGSGTR